MGSSSPRSSPPPVASPAPSSPPLPYDRAPLPLPIPRVPFSKPPPLPLLGSPVPSPSTPLTLESAIGSAMLRNPRVRTAVAEVEAQVARIWEVAAGYRPQVRLQYSASRSQQPLGVPFVTSIFGRSQVIQAAPFTITQFEDRLQLQQLLSDGGRTRALVRQNVDNARAAYADLAWVTFQLAHDVRAAWLLILEARAQVGVAEETLANASEHLKLTEASYRAGEVARADIVYATTPATRARMALGNARTLVRLAQARLNELIGSDPAVPLLMADGYELPAAPADLATARAEAQQGRQDLEGLRQVSAARRAAVDAARRSRSVTISAQADYRTVGYGNEEVAPPHNGWYAGLLLSYPLLDGGLITHQVEEARAQARASESRQESLARQIDAEVVRTWMELDNARERLELSRAEVGEAVHALAVARGQYEAGVNTIITVLDTQVRLARARTDEVTARFAVQRHLARLLLVTGR